MDFKEFAEKPMRLTPGHRLCAGCPAPIVAKTVIGATDKPVVVSNATGCLEVATTIYPYTSWNVPWIHNLFENAAATISGAETAYRVLKKKGKITKDIRFVAFGGDGGTYDIGLQSLSGALERGHDFTYVCYDNEGYMNCLTRDSLIMTEKGLRKITEIRKGDKLYSFDLDTQMMVLRECAGVYDNGVKEVFEVKTLHHSLKTTGNHPFLTVIHNGRGKGNILVWKTVEELKDGDEVVVLSDFGGGKSFNFPKIRKKTKKDYKVNVLNDVIIPEKSDTKVMKYLGIYVGDGWIRSGRGDIGFALPEGTKERKELLKLHKEIFGSKYSENKNEIHINSINLANFISSLKFGLGAKNKTVPDWVFTLPLEEKEAFVNGLLLSDGYEVKGSKSKRYVSASFALLRTLRLLLQTMNYRVGKIHVQQKEKGTKVVRKRLLKDSEYGYICFSKPKKWNTKKYPSQYKYVNLLVENEYFNVEKINEIKKLDSEPTLDLQVKESHNFIANGYVVHNTGNQRSSATPMGASVSTAPEGKVHHGKEQWKKNLMEIVVAHDIPYAAQATIGNWIDFVKKAEKAHNTRGPSVLVVLSPCILFWGVPTNSAADITKVAADTCFWPLYEVEDGNYKLNYKPQQKLPITEFINTQSRFKHLLKPEYKGIVDDIQRRIDRDWAKLLKLAGEE